MDVGAEVNSIKKGTTSRTFPLYDAHGNMVLTLTRASGTAYSTSNARFYDVWGSVMTSNDDGDPSQRYCANLGHPSDDFVRGDGGNTDDDLIYMRARYYEPGTGRFVSEDPARHGLNWFAYTSNNPIGRVDRTGKSDVSELEALLIAAGISGLFVGQLMLLAYNSTLSPSAAQIAIVGLVFLATWFADLANYEGTHGVQIFAGAMILLTMFLKDGAAELLVAGHGDILQQSNAVFANYMLIIAIFAESMFADAAL